MYLEDQEVSTDYKIIFEGMVLTLKLKHTLPALNPVELLAQRNRWISLLLQIVWVSLSQMRLQRWQVKIHSQWRARTLEKQAVHLWRHNGGHVCQMAVGSLGSECVFVEWIAGLTVQDSKSVKDQKVTDMRKKAT